MGRCAVLSILKRNSFLEEKMLTGDVNPLYWSHIVKEKEKEKF